MKELIRNFFNDKQSQIRDKKYKEEMLNKIAKLEEKILPLFSDVDSLDIENLFKKIDPDKLIKPTTLGDGWQEKADGILKNNFFLINSLDVISFGDNIDWNYQHDTSANTYQLYIQCLNVVSHLCDAFVETKDKKYLYKGYCLMLEWILYIKTDEERNRFKWVDHTVANRVMNFTYFYNVAKNEIEFSDKIIAASLIEHGEFLENDKHYVQNNHGIMVDRSLLLLSIFMENYSKSEQWFQKGKLRITNAMYRDFSSKGVHLENSPSYHSMTRRIFNQVEELLKNNGLTLGKEIREKLIQTKDYIQYMIKPNQEIPLIGDSQKGSAKWSSKSFESFSDTHAGITIMQSKASEPINSTWLSFIAGYGRKTHKHRDDLSITLFYNGKDILTDSGRYNYDSKDKIRQYIMSPQAHSTISVRNKDYIVDDPFKNRNKIQTVNYVSNEVYDYVKGVNKAYDGIELSRSIVFFKPNIIVIHDKILSQTEEIVEQIFNLAPEVDINSGSKELLTAVAENDTVEFKQLIAPDDLTIIRGDRETPRAVISEEFGKLTNNTQAVFTKSGKNTEFLTVITLGEGKDKLNSVTYDKSSSILSINILEQEYKLII